MTASISKPLLHWYDEHARELPWRSPPRAAKPDDPNWPYRVWLSEVMLQQTTVAAVKPYFVKFTRQWPSVSDLALAREEDVMAAWAGLGYYSRARNLVKCARQVEQLGGFPSEESALRKLAGIGDYTAAAIAAIAFGKRALVLDANVERVVARLFAVKDPLPAARKPIRAKLDTITPSKRAGDFAQAMMDLGASICTAKAPRCLLCPLAKQCAAGKAGEAEGLPVKAPKKAKPERRGVAFWIEREGEEGRQVWLVKRPDGGMLGAMRALPDDGWSAKADGSATPPLAGKTTDLGAVRHTFTHAHLTLALYALEPEEMPDKGGEWWPVHRLEEAGIPTLFAKAARLALAKA